MKTIARLVILVLLCFSCWACSSKKSTYTITVDYDRNPYNTDTADICISVRFNLFPITIKGEFPCKSELPMSPQPELPKENSPSQFCGWTEILIGTWVSKNNDYVTFERDGNGFYYPKGERSEKTTFAWTCLDNGDFKNLTSGSEYRLVFPTTNSYIMNGDLWIRTQPYPRWGLRSEDCCQPTLPALKSYQAWLADRSNIRKVSSRRQPLSDWQACATSTE